MSEFDDLRKLGGYLADGFKIDEFVNLVQKRKLILDKSDLKLFDFARNYLDASKQGFSFFHEGVFPDIDPTVALSAFKIIFEVLSEDYGEGISTFLEDVKKIEAEIDLARGKRSIEPEQTKRTLKIFKAVSKKLLEITEKTL